MDQVTTGRYVGPEPLATVSQLVEATVPLPDGGSFTLQRPTVSGGAFALKLGTPLAVVSFSRPGAPPRRWPTHRRRSKET